MKWLVIIIFATLHGDFYIFHTPTFDSKEECMQAVIDKREVILRKLIMEYNGELPPITGVNCLQQDVIKEIIQRYENGETQT
tara:strand:+ start:647 stop:892 length:246 start_codon:yes stop_codon:yes gene_type:complete